MLIQETSAQTKLHVSAFYEIGYELLQSLNSIIIEN